MNELAFLVIILLVMTPTYLVYFNKPDSKPKIFLSLLLFSFGILLVLGVLWFKGILIVKPFTHWTSYSLVFLINLPSLLRGYYKKKKMLEKVNKDPQKYYTTPILTTNFVVIIAAVVRFFLN